jgi:tetratricopeptide (TPR) repeat protein
MESDSSLRHLAFFEALANADENDSNWRSLSAGLVVMRLVDDWIDAGYTTITEESWSVGSVREAIAELADTTPLRRILSAVVDTISGSTCIDVHALAPRLMAYGQTLEYDARWTLAADVYNSIVTYADPVEDSDLVVSAYIQLAFSLRMVERLDEAAVAYAGASRVAHAAGDMLGILRGRLGDAKIAMARGNMPHAEGILEETITNARDRGFGDLESRALTDRAYIAGVTGQHDRAIRFSYAALEASPNARDRDRILGNIATGFRLLGLFDTARDAYLVLAATSQEQYVRWLAELNLMELAAQQQIELQFDRYRRDLESADFSPFLRVTYLLHVGRGYHLLGRPETGIPYLELAVETAAKFKLNQLMFESESALAEAKRRDGKTIPKVESKTEVEVKNVIDAVQQMKVMAGIG